MGLFAELKRRNVFRVAIAYAVIAWLLAQVADLAFDNFGAPDWVPKSVMFILVLGLPLAIFFAWAFELTPEGLKKESEVDRSQSITGKTGRKLDFFIIGVLVIAVGFLLFDKFGPTGTDQTPVEAAVTTGRPSIAVLPFANRSNRDEDQFFTDGIHDDLLTTIANIGSMKVISRTSVMKYQNGEIESLGQVAEELGVANILEGGVQRSGNQVRINVQLIDAATDEHLWAEIYDRELTAENLFAIQSEVSNAIAAALHAALSPEEAQRINAIPTRNLEAYELYLLARKRWRSRTAESTTESVELFQNAIDLDPDFALAWVGLSDAYRHSVAYSRAPRDEYYAMAESAIKHALELDDQSGEAYATLGGLHSQLGNNDEALVALKKALQLSPNYSPAYNWYGIALESMDRFDEAMAIYEQGLERDPLSVILNKNFADMLQFAGEFAAARARYERIVEIDPESTFGYYGVANVHYLVAGRIDKELPWLLEAIEKDPGNENGPVYIAFSFLDLGDPVSAKRWLEKSFDIRADNDYAIFSRAIHALFVGDLDKARIDAQATFDHSDNQYLRFYALEILFRGISGIADLNDAIAAYKDIYPNIDDADALVVTNVNYRAAIHVAALLIKAGEERKAGRILDKVLVYTKTLPMLGSYGYFFARAKIYALRGDRLQAIAELERIIDAGVTASWWYEFDHSLGLEPLHSDPEFQALRARVAANVAEQLADVNKKESQSFVN